MKAFLTRFVAAVAIAAAAAPLAAQDGVAVETPLVDHHIHIFSPASSAVLKAICKAVGPEHCPEEISKDPSTGGDVVRALDAAGIKKGVLLSGAYFFTSPVAAIPPGELAQQTRAENSFIVGEAKAHCGRLVPIISVNPLWPGAVAEIDHWGKVGGAVGVKMHLGNSGFDFRDAAQVRNLAAAFAAADRNRLAIVIHLQTQLPTYGPEDARIFLSKVLPSAPHVPIQIAHVGSGGGLDKGVLSVLAVFADAMRDRPSLTRNLVFDLAMVPDLFSNTRKLSAAPTDDVALGTMMRRVGLRRFVPGSDYTSGLDLRAYYANQKTSLALGEADWRAITHNQAAYVKRAAPCGRR